MDFCILLTLVACFSVHNLVMQECFVFLLETRFLLSYDYR